MRWSVSCRLARAWWGALASAVGQTAEGCGRPGGPALPPGRDVSTMPITITTAMASEDEMRPRPSPPSAGALVTVSPSVAPSGRVST